MTDDSIREILESILKVAPEEKLNIRTPGYVLVFATENGPLTLSNIPSSLCKKLLSHLDFDNTREQLFSEH